MSEADRRPTSAEAQARFIYDPTLRGRWAEAAFAEHQQKFPFGTPERSRFLLGIMAEGFPTPVLREEYFATLDALLAARPVLPEPGQLVLGLGTGRTGSTTLTALLATIPGALSTHENPPHVFWQPLPQQLEFHQRRFERLLRHFSLVVDVAHWWLPALGPMRRAFPNLRYLALIRDLRDCTNSFLAIKGGERGLNHWAAPHNGIWAPGLWDPTYPSYSLPPNASSEPRLAKMAMIGRYVGEYNSALRALAAAEPDHWLLTPTESLSSAADQQRIFDFLGQLGRPLNERLNVGSTQHSELTPAWF